MQEEFSERSEVAAKDMALRRRSLLAPSAMVLAQVIVAGMFVLSKIILNKGIFVYSFLAYRSIIGAISVVPFAFFFERNMVRMLNWQAAVLIFINAITGITMGMGFSYYGIHDTTATYASCFYNMVPIVTFILSIIFRIERLGFGVVEGKLKIFGAVITVIGAMLITLYKGRTIFSHNVQHNLGENNIIHLNWKRGTFFLISSCLIGGFWYIGQAKLFKIFPSRYWATSLTCAIGSIQSVLVGVTINHSYSPWRLGWNLQHLVILYSGVLTTGLLFCITTWVTTLKGPTYTSMFNSLSLIFVAFVETLFMSQDLTIGSLIGIIVIIVGLSAFLWAKGKEAQKHEETPVSSRGCS